jgi:hypothetical protein
MDHAVSFNEQLETFEVIYSLTSEEKETEEPDFENTDDEQADE